MPNQKPIDELTTAEIRQILVNKQRHARQARLDRYRRNGRLVRVVPEKLPPLIEDLRAVPDPNIGVNSGNSTQGRRKRVLDYILLSIEGLAIIGLIYLFSSVFGLWQTLNRETAAAMVLPTFTPTPLVRAVVLPSGHTPPTSPGGARPNDDEIPIHLRPMVQALANIPIPTPSVEQASRIQIPAIDVDAPVVQGDGWEQLKKGVAQHLGTANPGQKGNMVLSAHNDVFGEIFRDLDQLEAGDEITLFTTRRSYTYVVTGWQIVEPTQVDVMDPTSYVSATLISCYPYLIDTERIVVKAQLMDS